MAIAAAHTNYAKEILDAIVVDVQANVSNAYCANVNRLRDPETDELDFLAKYGRAILIRLDTDEFSLQQSDTWESTYNFQARIYVHDEDENQHDLFDLVEDFKHSLFVNQSGQNDWFQARYTSVVYNDPDEDMIIKTADVEFFAAMRAI